MARARRAASAQWWAASSCLPPRSKCWATVAASSPWLSSQRAAAAWSWRAELFARRGVGDLANERVLEEELACAGEARRRVLDDQLGADELAEGRVRFGDAERSEAGVPDAEAEDARAHDGFARGVVERVEAHLNGGLDGGRGRDVLARGDDARELFGEERRTRGLLRDLIEHRVVGAGPDDGAGDCG